MEDLINYVSSALQEFTGNTSSISRRQIFKDIDFMRSEAGFKAPIEGFKDGKKTYYRYSDRDYVLTANKLNPIEAELIKNALNILNRFKGILTFDYIHELSFKLQKSFHLEDLDHVIFFDQNEHLKNIDLLSDLLKAIQSKDVLEVVYKSYKQAAEEKFIFHPYFLKQYNKRWFLFGQREEYSEWSNLALDRIVSFSKNYAYNYKAIQNDPEEFFEDIIGVTKPADSLVEKVVLKVDHKLWPYIDSKPLHPSQKVVQRQEDCILVQLELIPNYEFYAQILSLGAAIEVLEPHNVRNEIRTRLNKCLERYRVEH